MTATSKRRPYKNDHVNYSERIKPLKRHYQGRLVGESTGWAMDARGDESLYKPSELGVASCDVRRVAAGENRPFTLTFQTGPRELRAGATVIFWMPGQGSLGTVPQTEDEDEPGYLELETNANCDLRLIRSDRARYDLSDVPSNSPLPKKEKFDVANVAVGFAIEKGRLNEGESIRLRVGRQGGFTWKCLAGRKEFKVLVSPSPDSSTLRLPEPVRIDVDPLEPDHLEVLLSGSARKGERLRCVVSARDKYDNRIPVDGPVAIVGDDDETVVHLAKGRAEFCPGEMGDDIVSVRARSAALDLNVTSNPCVPADEFQLYFGDMHTHDMNSTAEGFPIDCYQWARDEKRLDFQALPVQVHRWIDDEKWFLVKHMNEYFLEEGKFVTFLSFEWQHSGCGDKVIHYLGGDQPYLPIDDPRYDSPEKLYAALRESDAFVISHHPGYELDLHVPGTRWEVVENDVDRILELWSMHGSSEGFDPEDRPVIPPRRVGGVNEGLRSGVRMGLCAGSDTHVARPGGSVDDCRPYYGGLCAVWAKDLTRRGLFEAFMARRTYALTGDRIALRFRVDEAWMGSEVPFNPRPRVTVETWALDVIAEIQILRQTEVVHRMTPNAASATLEWDDAISDPAFYHCRVVQANGHMAVASPVWVG